jgi:hypothetical protein
MPNSPSGMGEAPMPAQVIRDDGEAIFQLRRHETPGIARRTDAMHQDQRRTVSFYGHLTVDCSRTHASLTQLP